MLVFMNEGGIKTFSKGESKEFVANSSIIKEWLIY